MTAGCQPSSKRRRALRRDQRLRAMHLAQASEPSFTSAPHTHAGPRRHPGRPERSIICSPSSHQRRSSLLSGDTRARSTTARIPSAPGTFVPAGLPCFHSSGLGSPASLPATLCAPLVFLIHQWREPAARESRAGMMRRERVLLTSCGSPLASFLPGSCCEAGPHRLGDSTARAGGSRGYVPSTQYTTFPPDGGR